MRDGVARLRFWLAGSALLLLAVIAAYIGYARYITHIRKMKLPLPPGVNIEREGQKWTLSYADGSRTIYTIQAANFHQGKNGKTSLHDVSVLLFGKRGDRHDRVYGQDFEYDQPNGVLRALGTVHLDLQDAPSSASKALTRRPANLGQGTADLQQVIHVTTSGLVYLQKLGIAATSEDVDIEVNGLTGHARGADYSSDSGMLMLHSAVELSGTHAGHALHITAGHAQFDEHSQQVTLENAKYDSEGRAVSADHAVLDRASNGTLRRVEAEGNVTMTREDGTVRADHADVRMNGEGRPTQAVLRRKVRYSESDPLREVQITSDAAQIEFAETLQSTPRHALFAGGVRVVQRAASPGATEHQWSSDEITGNSIETWMTPAPHGRIQLKNAAAHGGAMLVISNPPNPAKKSQPLRTQLNADDLQASFLPGAGSPLKEITGHGNTSITQLTSDGVEQTSSGDSLTAQFKAASGVPGRNTGVASSFGGDDLQRAVQTGNIRVVRHVPARTRSGRKPVPEETQHVSADTATYDGTTSKLLLGGAVRMEDSGGILWASHVVIDRDSGDMEADGAVKVSYGAGPGRRTVVADRASLQQASGLATFHGDPVRVWEGGNQILAPVVELDKTADRFLAHGAAGNGAQDATAVRTTLADTRSSESTSSPGTAGAAHPVCAAATRTTSDAKAAKDPGATTVRILSAGLVYSGANGEVEFTGGTRAETPDATIHAARATAYLSKLSGAKESAAAPSQWRLDRIESSGHVEVTRPGTQVSGEQLVYQAAQRVFVLSGSSGHPARAAGVNGTTTAAAFRFTACDDTLEALGVTPGMARQRVQTDAVANDAGRREVVK